MKRCPEAYFTGIKVLVVEDESIIAWDVEQLFRDHGANEVLVAPSLKQARALFAEHEGIGLAIIDLKLEDGNGGELIEEVTGKGIPIIITTGYDNPVYDAIPVILKPYGASTLIAAAMRVIKQ